MIYNDLKTAIDTFAFHPAKDDEVVVALVPESRRGEIVSLIRSMLAQSANTNFTPSIEGLILFGVPIRFVSNIRNIVVTWLPRSAIQSSRPE